MKNDKNENRQTHVILEGFRHNGLQIRNQRIFLRIVAPVKIDFRHFFDFYIFRLTRRDRRDRRDDYFDYFVKGFP